MPRLPDRAGREARDVFRAPLTQVKIARRLRALSASHRTEGSIAMLDILLLGLAAGFFVLAIGYAYACNRL